jgi:ABC-type uncharacterized transport system ATPase subunit
MDTSTAKPLVFIEHFRMTFGRSSVIRDLSFDITRGESFGSIGLLIDTGNWTGLDIDHQLVSAAVSSTR